MTALGAWRHRSWVELGCSLVAVVLASWWAPAQAAEEANGSATILTGPSNQAVSSGQPQTPASETPTAPATSGPGASGATGQDLAPSEAITEAAELVADPADASRPPAAIDAPADNKRDNGSMNEETIKDLDRIRRRVGRSPLAGSLLDSSGSAKDSNPLGDSDFARQLRDRFGRPRARGPYSTKAPSEVDARRRKENGTPSADAETMRRAYMDSLMRRMEVLAADLDAVDLGQDAEQIRAVRARVALELGAD